ncbi:MAG: hypothetical protein V1731_03410 [Candidatus Aenigmatarchaeota archaeon]
MSTNDLTVVKAQLHVPEGCRYSPNNNYKGSKQTYNSFETAFDSALFERGYNLYKRNYPDPDEREPKRKLVAIARGQLDTDEGMSNFYLGIKPEKGSLLEGKVVGYNIFDVVTMGAEKEGAIGMDWYLGVDPKMRTNGYGSKILRSTVGQMKNIATRRGRQLLAVHAELDDPERMDAEFYKASASIMDPKERIKFWAGQGSMEVIAGNRRDWYMQPRLNKDSEPVDYLIFTMLPLDKRLAQEKEISAEKFLKQFLRKHVYYGFEATPGSDLDGQRNPETDASYVEMARKIREAGKVNLVPLER